jgi:hypothetical protein
MGKETAVTRLKLLSWYFDGGTEETHEKLWLEWPVLGPRFEPETPGIRRTQQRNSEASCLNLVRLQGYWDSTSEHTATSSFQIHTYSSSMIIPIHPAAFGSSVEQYESVLILLSLFSGLERSYTGSQVRIPLRACMFVLGPCVVLPFVGWGLVTGWSLMQGVRCHMS